MRNLLIVIPHYNDLEGLQKTLGSVVEEVRKQFKEMTEAKKNRIKVK